MRRFPRSFKRVASVLSSPVSELSASEARRPGLPRRRARARPDELRRHQEPPHPRPQRSPLRQCAGRQRSRSGDRLPRDRVAEFRSRVDTPTRRQRPGRQGDEPAALVGHRASDPATSSGAPGRRVELDHHRPRHPHPAGGGLVVPPVRSDSRARNRSGQADDVFLRQFVGPGAGGFWAMRYRPGFEGTVRWNADEDDVIVRRNRGR